MRAKQKIAGYREINTPELLDRSLWEKSGHWDKFGEHMFTSTTPDEKIFAIKPTTTIVDSQKIVINKPISSNSKENSPTIPSQISLKFSM